MCRCGMGPDERAQWESAAERALRRGELSEALGALRRLAAAFPADEHVAARLARLQDALEPAELLNPKATFRAEPDGPPQSPLDDAERRAARGDFVGAIRLYQQLLAAQPTNQLARERLDELTRLSQVQAPRSSPPTVEGTLNALLHRISSRRRG